MTEAGDAEVPQLQSNGPSADLVSKAKEGAATTKRRETGRMLDAAPADGNLLGQNPATFRRVQRGRCAHRIHSGRVRNISRWIATR